MLKIIHYLGQSSGQNSGQSLGQSPQLAADSVTLAFEQRQKGRFKTVSDQGLELGVFLERGQVLAQDDQLQAEDGRIFTVIAKPEAVVTAHADDWPSFARACYHLGNRHVTLQLGERWLRFQPDHVLEHLAEHLGLRLEIGEAPFHPESGAYHGAHAHGHDDSHEHTSSHEHKESHKHGHSHEPEHGHK
ncbi:urease accessory protein UreE [Oceanisphaera sp. W20_SRM_FM3]|uniref:urease accessory protein UreE n=1 Tax=Oceanisphaera sp. W20_SRM_FM3 TaxID=3240267 RepID=UPI003F98A8E7